MNLSKIASLGLLLSFSTLAHTDDRQAVTATQMIPRAGHKIAFHIRQGSLPVIVLDAGGGQIGRASCRERVFVGV